MAEPIEHDIFDELGLAQFIMQRRIYDVLIAMFSNMNPEEAEKLVEMHEQGIFISPPPAWMGENDGG